MYIIKKMYANSKDAFMWRGNSRNVEGGLTDILSSGMSRLEVSGTTRNIIAIIMKNLREADKRPK